MTDDPSSKQENAPASPETAGLSKRDLALARVDEIMSGGRVPRPRSSPPAGDDLPEEETAPINIDEVAAEIAPGRVGGQKKKGAAKPAKKGLAALHWFVQTLLLLFVLVWVFLLGIFIGRGYLMESEMGRELIARVSAILDRPGQEPEVAAEEAAPASVPAEAPESPPPAAPQPPEAAAEESDDTLQTVLTAAQSVDPQTPPAEAEEDDPAAVAPETPAEESEPPPQAAAEPEAAPEPETPPAPPVLVPLSQPGYAVQTTYALNERAAAALIDRLKRLGFPAYYYKNSRDQYLVRVGRFATGEEARRARDDLASRGYKDPYISKLAPGER